MKKLMALMTALLILLTAPAMAETAEEILAPFLLNAPLGSVAEVAAGGGSVTFVSTDGATTVVAQVISRVLDENADHQEALAHLMHQFSPECDVISAMEMADHFYCVYTIAADSRDGLNGAKVDQVNVMILYAEGLYGNLLILSGYDTNGNTYRVDELINALLQTGAADGMPLLPAENPDA